MTGLELRTLRALRRGPLYAGALALIVGVTDARARRLLAGLRQRGYVRHRTDIGVQTFEITEAGEEIVAAMTP